MGKENALFHSTASWDMTNLPSYIRLMPSESDDPEDRSSLNAATEKVRLNGFIAMAIEEWCMGSKSEICVIKLMDGVYASEWKQSDTQYVLCYANRMGELNVSIAKGADKLSSLAPFPSIGNPSDKADTTSILSCYLAMLAETEEGATYLNACREQFSMTGKLPRHELYKLNGLLQASLNNGILKCNINNGNITRLDGNRIQNNALAGEILTGHSHILMPGEGASTHSTRMGQAKKMFADYAASKHWSPEEEARIRNYPDDYIVPDEVIEIAKWYVESRNDRIPANNFCWLGCTGAGKSVGVELLSCILHTPLYIMTCSTNMETGDFLSTLVPSSAPALALQNMPSFDDIIYDPAGAYQRLTGQFVDDISSQEVLEAYGKACAANAGKDSYFRRVKSEYIRALETGAIVEIQEFSRIRDAGVLVGLNEYDHAGAIIPLIDGEYTVRHPDAITVWTDNVGYNSCRPVDPSVMRRMATVFETFDLEKNTVVDRVMYNTSNAVDRSLVSKMYDVWEQIKNYCTKEDITEGDLSPSDLENWVSRVSHTGPLSLYTTCKMCCVAKTTRDKDTQFQIYNGVVTPAIDKLLAWVDNLDEDQLRDLVKRNTGGVLNE